MKVKTDFAPNPYITAGKEYDARDYDKSNYDSFRITCDHGTNLSCLKQRCAHLNGGNWIVIEERPVQEATQ